MLDRPSTVEDDVGDELYRFVRKMAFIFEAKYPEDLQMVNAWNLVRAFPNYILKQAERRRKTPLHSLDF